MNRTDLSNAYAYIFAKVNCMDMDGCRHCRKVAGWDGECCPIDNDECKNAYEEFMFSMKEFIQKRPQISESEIFELILTSETR